jgi:hypothetical protein
MLTAFILFGIPGRSSSTAQSPTHPIESGIGRRTDLAVTAPSTAPLGHRRTLARFNPWRTRLKSVLQETHLRIFEACDFRSTVLPDPLNTSLFNEAAPCHFAARAPLRC